jgi:hypothetical protein
MMVRAHREIVTIQRGGRVEVASDELPAGRQAEVIVLVAQEARNKSYLSLFGSGKGAFATPQEADAFLRRERDTWQR